MEERFWTKTIEDKLDEADRAAQADPERFRGEDVFRRIRRRISSKPTNTSANPEES